MVPRACSAVLGIMLVLAGAGCASSSLRPTTRSVTGWGSVSPSLVVPGMGSSPSDATGWEYSRNDERLSVGYVPPASQVDYVEIETRERLRISSGRPHDSSYTRIHSIRRRLER